MHVGSRFDILLVALVGLIAFLAIGCRSTAEMPVWSPAELPLAGIHRLAIAPIEGQLEFTTAANQQLIDGVQASPSYQVIVLPPMASPGENASPVQLQEAYRAAAQHSHAEVVLVSRLKLARSGEMRLGNVSIGTSQSTVEAKLEFRLIDVASAETLREGVVSSTFRGELGLTSDGEESFEEVVRRLVADCANDLVKKLCAQSQRIEVELATASWGSGRSHVRSGNRHAASGDWEAAARQWQAALAENPDCDAALYNLGLKHEAAHQYATAREYFAKANRLADKSEYTAAFARADASASKYRQAMIQSGRPTRLPQLR